MNDQVGWGYDLLTTQLNTLADSFRKKYNTSNKLTIVDMNRLLVSGAITILPKSNFGINFNGRPATIGEDGIELSANHDSGAYAWGFIVGFLQSPVTLYDTYVKSGQYKVTLHLYVTKVLYDGGDLRVKWNNGDGTDVNINKSGMFNIIVPGYSSSEDTFDLVLHPFFNFLYIDPQKSYIDAVPI